MSQYRWQTSILISLVASALLVWSTASRLHAQPTEEAGQASQQESQNEEAGGAGQITPSQAPPTEPDLQPQTPDQQPSVQQEATAKKPEAKQDSKIKDAPGPIRLELTNRAELKYEQYSFDPGHMYRLLFVGSYVFPTARMTIGFDELPLVNRGRLGDAQDYMLGDAVLRFSWVPYISSKGDSGVVFVPQLTVPTGDYEGGAGSGRYDLEPRLFYAYKVNNWYTVVPAVYDKFTIDKKERSAADTHLLTLRLLNIFFPSPTTYIVVDPRFYYEFKQKAESGELRLQVGTMLTRNIASYLEYSVGLGNERPFEGKFVCGVRYLFR